MEKRRIGSLSVSVVGLGCNNFGMRLDEAGTARVVDAAIEKGINFFDTADIYGGTHSEEFLGRALGKRREQIVLATKFGMPIDEQHKGAKPQYVKQALEASLRRLGTDRIDLYQLHRPDSEVPIAETLGALDDLVKAGKVREIGCSNFDAQKIAAAQSAARGAQFASVQNEYSLLKRDPEQGVLDACLKHKLGFLPYFPLASGVLTGKYTKDAPAPHGTRLSDAKGQLATRFLSERNIEIAARLNDYASQHGRSLLELAFSWLLARPAVVSVIAGATSTDQINANASAASWQLSPDDLKQIDALCS